MQTLTISIISGASRQGRFSVKVAQYLHSLLNASEQVEQVHFLDIHDYNFPNYLDGSERDETLQGRVNDFSSKLFASDAIILVSPEYNGGIAGSTKNALDYFRKEYERRPFGLVSVSSGTMGGINAMHQMVDFVSYVGGLMCAKRLLVSEVQKAFSLSGELLSERLERNGMAFIDELLLFSSTMKMLR
jgi:azobenzene reductase